jgi:hypothetical protein
MDDVISESQIPATGHANVNPQFRVCSMAAVQK